MVTPIVIQPYKESSLVEIYSADPQILANIPGTYLVCILGNYFKLYYCTLREKKLTYTFRTLDIVTVIKVSKLFTLWRF